MPASSLMHVVRRRVRRFAVPVLSLWLLTVVINVLAPCCEALAASIPHEHASPQIHASGPTQAAHDQSAPVGDDDHCPNLDRPDSGLVDNLVNQADYPAAALPVPEQTAGDDGEWHAIPIWTHLVVRDETGPPVYLATQRFRI